MDTANRIGLSAVRSADVAFGRHEDDIAAGDGDVGGVTGPWVPGEIVSEALVADAHLCDQVAALLSVSEASVRRALLGESVRILLGITGWVLLREAGERDGDLSAKRSEALLVGWAERRNRGVWRKVPDRRVERCECGAAPKPKRSHEPEDEDDVCTVCRGSGIRLKALGFPSGALVEDAVSIGDTVERSDPDAATECRSGKR